MNTQTQDPTNAQSTTPHHSLDVGGQLLVLCFGKPHNWSLNNLQAQEDLLYDEQGLFERIRFALLEKGISSAYAPRLREFNATMADPKQFGIAITHKGFTLRRGVNASGMLVPRNTALLVPTGDCPTVVMHHYETNTIVGFHAGLGELVNLRPFKAEFPSPPLRGCDSVVEKAAQYFHPAIRKEVDVFVRCGIGACCYCYADNHPKFGDINRKIKAHITRYYGSNVFLDEDCARGHISMTQLVRAQAEKFGFNPHKVFTDGICTSCSPSVWHSNAGEGKEAGRNMVMVINCG